MECCLLSLTTPAPALRLLAVAVIVARSWWSFWGNAFSDLGNPNYDFTSSIIFNLGLYTSSLLLVITVIHCFRLVHSAVKASLIVTGYSLGLVATYSEVYHQVHFIVSALFFLSILALTLTYPTSTRNIPLLALAVIADILAAVLWYFHFTSHNPPGAAPPELASVAILLTFYYHIVLRGERLCVAKSQ
jgi:hypothetical membrane protein